MKPSLCHTAEERVQALDWGQIERTLSANGSAVLSQLLSVEQCQTLALLYQSLGWVGDAELCNSVEYSNATVYRKTVLEKLHKERLIEFDKKNKRAKISPKGSAHVETEILSTRP